MKVIGYKLSYKCVRQTKYESILCETKRELDGFLYDIRKYLTDYNIVKVLQNTSEIISV
jgi:hypothetical protein